MPDEKINQRADKMQQRHDQNPRDFFAFIQPFILRRRNQHPDPKNRRQQSQRQKKTNERERNQRGKQHYVGNHATSKKPFAASRKKEAANLKTFFRKTYCFNSITSSLMQPWMLIKFEYVGESEKPDSNSPS